MLIDDGAMDHGGLLHRAYEFLNTPIGGSSSSSVGIGSDDMFGSHDMNGLHSGGTDHHDFGSFEPLTNIDGKPMCGGIAIHGHTYGTTD